MDARELLKITAQLLGSVTSGYDAIYSEQKKVTELLYHPHFKYTPISRSRTKSSLLENGWTLNEIENTDLNELLKIYAFKDAVDEFENIKYLDENTMF